MNSFAYYRPPFNSKENKGRRRSLRLNMPKAEIILWGYLRNRQMGFKFRRQYGVEPYCLDFYCPKLRLAIEVDGDTHFENGAAEHDMVRDRFLTKFDIRTIRFTNDQIYNDTWNVLDQIQSEIGDIDVKKGRTPPNLP